MNTYERACIYIYIYIYIYIIIIIIQTHAHYFLLDVLRSFLYAHVAFPFFTTVVCDTPKGTSRRKTQSFVSKLEQEV